MAVLRIVKKTSTTRIMSIISTHMFNSGGVITVTIRVSFLTYQDHLLI